MTMSGNGGSAQSPGPQQNQSQLNVLGQYIKDFSFENPNAPRSLAPTRDRPSERYDLSSSVYRVQHDLAWLLPNLGADQLTTDLVGWLQMDAEIKRRGGSSDEAES